MLDQILSRVPRSLAWRLVTPSRLHRAALGQMQDGHPAVALRLLELAAAGYRRELQVESLARLRVHERMCWAIASPELHGAKTDAEIAGRLSRLEWIEDVEPPFEPVEAGVLLSRWLARGGQRPRAADGAAVSEGSATESISALAS